MDRFLLTDADNTLWDSNRVFAKAQLNLLNRVETVSVSLPLECPDQRLAFVRKADQGIASRHPRNLRYPPHLLIRVLADTLAGTHLDCAITRHLAELPEAPVDANSEQRIQDAFFTDLRQTPALRAGVREGLAALRERGYSVVIATEAPREKAEQNARALGIDQLISGIFSGDKRDGSLYEQVICALNLTPSVTFMVGDQMDRDIHPANRFGFKTVYFPGGFTPDWGHDDGHLTPPLYSIASFAELHDLVCHGSHAVTG